MADPVTPPLTPASGADTATPYAAPGKTLPEAARRALQEAAERRAAIDAAILAANETPEIGGPAGLDPTRYGDWERKGVAIDFS